MDWLQISSYQDERISSEDVKLLKWINANIRDRHVLVVEDIVDSGISVEYLRKKLITEKPGSLEFISLLIKLDAKKVPYRVKYWGFKIPNKWVVGMGMDDGQILRNLPQVYVMN